MITRTNTRPFVIFFLLICLLVGIFYVFDLIPYNRLMKEVQDQQTSGTPLPGFCARCRALQADVEMQKCDIIGLERRQWSFKIGDKEGEQVPGWFYSWSQYKQSFPILKVSLTGESVRVIQPDAFVVPRDDYLNYYFRYLQNPDADRFGLTNYSGYWRLDATDSLYDRMKKYEQPHVQGKLKEEWRSAQKDRFTNHHPWYQIEEYDLHEDYLSGKLGDVANREWTTLVDLTSTDEKLAKLPQQIPSVNYPYGYQVTSPLRQLMKKYEKQVGNKTAVILGSYSPWVELQVFLGGARHVTTVEYLHLPIPQDHKHMAYLHPEELHRRLAAGPIFDFAVSFSSLEHSGLGRYGDPYNPDADLMEMARYSCIVKPGGLLFLGVPNGADVVQYSMHRFYGPKRYTMLSECWKVVETETVTWTGTFVNHPWFVMQNLRGCEITL